MTKYLQPRINHLREESHNSTVCLSIERALIVTQFYKDNHGRYSTPMMRAQCFMELCKKKTIYIGERELIVGEKGPLPKHVPTFPEIICHNVDDLETLRARDLQPYHISDEDIERYNQEVIPFWKGQTQYDRTFNQMEERWTSVYHAGVFTEFMEQRAAGHTALDDKVYRFGMNDLIAKIQKQILQFEASSAPSQLNQLEELRAMLVTCEAAIVFARRHAELAEQLMAIEEDELRKSELEQIARVCRKVPAEKPDTLWEAIQMYWFVHLGTVTELNGWDAMSPGHFDQHLYPYYKNEINNNLLTRDQAKELLSCLWIKFNNQPAPPKVGVTALESGTYNDFVNINIGGVDKEGCSGENALSHIMLEITDELHLLQPGTSIHISKRNSDQFLLDGLAVIGKGYGYPSIFNPDLYIQSLLNQGKSLQDAHEGGCSGCIEVGAFGKEAYILTGYLNLPKILEITLHNGIDPRTGQKVGMETGTPKIFTSYNELYKAFTVQLKYFIDLKINASNTIDQSFSRHLPAPFLSLFIDDCIAKGKDYYDGGPRYNTNYIQCTGLGTVTDSLSAIKKHVYETGFISLQELVIQLDKNFKNSESLRLHLLNKTPFFGNDDHIADTLAVEVFNDLFNMIEGKENTRGGYFHMNMLSTTCHVYFGQMIGATSNGRLSGTPISDGTSPSQGADLQGPAAVAHSLSKLNQQNTGGTLLNVRLLPSFFDSASQIQKIAAYVRAYFSMGGHHIQFNVVSTNTLLEAQKDPESYRDLMVRVAGYSDYFNDMNEDLQSDIITRTENRSF